MSNEALLHSKKMGIQEESDWAAGTITAATRLLPLREAGIILGLQRQHIRPGRISGRASLKQSFLGTYAPKFTIPTFGYPVGGVLKLLKMALGSLTTAEVASFAVSAGVNDKIDFTEDGGAEVTATLTAGTYAMGTSSAVAGSLCALIKAQMEAVNGASTYTVTFSTTTGLVTITKSSGVFVLLWATGTNAATAADTLLGFAADTASAIAATAPTALVAVYDHTIKPLDAYIYGLSAGMTAQIKLADGKVFDALDAVVDVLKMSYKPNQELWYDAECEGRLYADSSADLASLSEETIAPLTFAQLGYTVGGVAHEISALEINYSNNLKKDLFVNSEKRSKFPRNGFRAVSGSFTMDITDSRAYAIYTDFLAGTQPALVATFTAAASSIKTGYTYTITKTLGKVAYDLEAVPGGGGQAAPEGSAPFTALDDGTNGELKIVVRTHQATI